VSVQDLYDRAPTFKPKSKPGDRSYQEKAVKPSDKITIRFSLMIGRVAGSLTMTAFRTASMCGHFDFSPHQQW